MRSGSTGVGEGEWEGTRRVLLLKSLYMGSAKKKNSGELKLQVIFNMKCVMLRVVVVLRREQESGGGKGTGRVLIAVI